MARKNLMKWSSKHEDFILDKMCEGMLPAHIFAKYPLDLPSLRTFNRHQVDDVEFRSKVECAYTVIYQLRMAELESLSTGLAEDHYPGADFRQAEAALKRRVDVLKFDLGKMAGMMTPRFNAKQIIEHQGTVTADQTLTYNIVNYSTPQLELSSIIELDITPKT